MHRCPYTHDLSKRFQQFLPDRSTFQLKPFCFFLPCLPEDVNRRLKVKQGAMSSAALRSSISRMIPLGCYTASSQRAAFSTSHAAVLQSCYQKRGRPPPTPPINSRHPLKASRQNLKGPPIFFKKKKLYIHYLYMCTYMYVYIQIYSHIYVYICTCIYSTYVNICVNI